MASVLNYIQLTPPTCNTPWIAHNTALIRENDQMRL